MSRAIGRLGFHDHTDHRVLTCYLTYKDGQGESVWAMSYRCRECKLMIVSEEPTFRVFSGQVYEVSVIGCFIRGTNVKDFNRTHNQTTHPIAYIKSLA